MFMNLWLLFSLCMVAVLKNAANICWLVLVQFETMDTQELTVLIRT